VVAPPKRRVAPGGRRPPPLPRAVRSGPGPGPLDAEQLDGGLGQGDLHRWSPMGQVEGMGQAMRAWRRGGEQPAWVRAVGWTIVISFLGPLVLAAWQALLR
jgi:hypothetical protein